MNINCKPLVSWWTRNYWTTALERYPWQYELRTPVSRVWRKRQRRFLLFKEKRWNRPI